MSTSPKKKDGTRFQTMARRINVYLDKEGSPLSFEGYTETVRNYFRLQDIDLYETFMLITECNLWSNYMSEVENIIQFHKDRVELETNQLEAKISKKSPENELDVLHAQKKKELQDFKLFYKQVQVQKKFFIQAHLHCKRLYAKNFHALLYKDL